MLSFESSSLYIPGVLYVGARSPLYCLTLRTSSSRDLIMSLPRSMDAGKRQPSRDQRATRSSSALRRRVLVSVLSHRDDIWSRCRRLHRPASCHKSHPSDIHGYNVLGN